MGQEPWNGPSPQPRGAREVPGAPAPDRPSPWWHAWDRCRCVLAGTTERRREVRPQPPGGLAASADARGYERVSAA
jgi:hypothetical protein